MDENFVDYKGTLTRASPRATAVRYGRSLVAVSLRSFRTKLFAKSEI